MGEAIASLFLSLPKIITMKFYFYLFIILTIVSSCSEEGDAPTFSKDYGSGMYISTDNGVSFYKDGVVKNQIYKEVNGLTLTGVERIKFSGTKAFILAGDMYSVNIETFEDKGIASGFVNPVDLTFISPDNRALVVDKDDSKVKEVDLDRMEIASVIETGDSTKPVFIVSRWYRSFVMNGGAEPDSLNDSTIVAIDYRDELVPLADFMGSLYLGDNPNSAVNINNLKILCKGIYDPNDLTTKTQSALVTVMQQWGDFQVSNSQTLNGIYNAQNLISNNDDTEYYFTAEDGIYSMNNNGSSIINITNTVSDVLYYQDEYYGIYSVVDSTTYYYNRDILYINDSQNSKNTIYKYDLDIGSYIDTIVVDGPVKDIAFY